jgi:hypothetical protein
VKTPGEGKLYTFLHQILAGLFFGESRNGTQDFESQVFPVWKSREK